MDLHLRGKSVRITGASKGIGAATAEAFAEEGCNVHLAARSTEAMQALAERFRTAHQVNVTAHTVDLRKSDDLHRLARETAGVDILVNNAGDIPGGSLDKIDEATWRHAWELKVFGYINLTRLVHADMKSRNHGVIVNIIGAAGERFNYDYITGSAGNAPSALLRPGRAPSSIALFARGVQPPAAVRCQHGRAIRPFVAHFAVDAAALRAQGRSPPRRQVNWMLVSIAFGCPD